MTWWGWALGATAAGLVAWILTELICAPEVPAVRTGDKPWET